MKYKLPIAIIVVAAGLSVFYYGKKPAKNTALQSTQSSPLSERKTQTTSTQTQSFHAVSLPALMQKEFDGRDLTLGKILSANESYTRYYITYKSGELTISGIMNVPTGTPPLGGFPVLILNHGHIDVSIYTNGRGLKREQDYLARQGFVVIHPDYRNHAESDKDPQAETSLRLGYAEDVINGIYAVKNSSLGFLNKEKIGMLGHSMGGGVAINTMVVKPDLVKAFVLYAPVSSNYEQNFERWTTRRPELATKVVELYGSPTTSPEFWKNVSAKNFLQNAVSPVLIFHGTRDDSVPYEWSTDLTSTLQTLNKEVSLITFEGEAHEFGPKWTSFMQQSSAFFNSHLKP